MALLHMSDELENFDGYDRPNDAAFDAAMRSEQETHTEAEREAERERSFAALMVAYEDYQMHCRACLTDHTQGAQAKRSAAEQSYFLQLMSCRIEVDSQTSGLTFDPKKFYTSIEGDSSSGAEGNPAYQRDAKYLGSTLKDQAQLDHMKIRRTQRVGYVIEQRITALIEKIRASRSADKGKDSPAGQELRHDRLRLATTLRTMTKFLDAAITTSDRYMAGETRHSGEPVAAHAVAVESFFWQTRAFFKNLGIDVLNASTWRDVFIIIRIHDLVEDHFPDAFLMETNEGDNDHFKYRLVLASKPSEPAYFPTLEEVCRNLDLICTKEEQEPGITLFRITEADGNALVDTQHRTLQTALYRSVRGNKRLGIIPVMLTDKKNGTKKIESGTLSSGTYQLREIVESGELMSREFHAEKALTTTTILKRAAEKQVNEKFPQIAALRTTPPYDVYYASLCKVMAQTTAIREAGAQVEQEKGGGPPALPVLGSETGQVQEIVWAFLASLYLGKHCDKLHNLLSMWAVAKKEGNYQKVGHDIISSVIEGSIIKNGFRQEEFERNQGRIEISPPADIAKLGMLKLYHQNMDWFTDLMTRQVADRIAREHLQDDLDSNMITIGDIDAVIEFEWVRLAELMVHTGN